MKIHEYQAKELFRRFDIPVPAGAVASDPETARQIARDMGVLPLVVKAQIHAGGRGKGGGVKVLRDLNEVRTAAAGMIGMNLITHQTGPDGKQVKKVLVEQALEIARELYLSIVPDRKSARHVVMVSRAGGMDIEQVAEKTPEQITKIYIDPLLGIQAFHCRQAAYGLDLPPAISQQFVPMLRSLYKLFVSYDCSLVEINPLVITTDGKILALDAKINFDDNALFRHKDILEYRDLNEEELLEIEASRYNLNYIKMDGNVGNMVNGAGLAMATMDIIKRAGAEPANFLDVGGGANAEMVENGLRIILSDKNVKAILINIFGGILRCDVLSNGVVQAAKNTGIEVPVVVRMEGTNIEEGRKILTESGLGLIFAADLKDAAEKIAKIVRKK
ncbi:MAG: ADP-forming succinate--CoA ligase subunit beta [Desulfobacterales bacterium]|nr:ADP-forming succinate--CoA ligase subunit beta [Desulfobacterales bacterium]